MSETELLTLLTSCHDRIRRTLRAVQLLATAAGVHDPRAPATADACARYLRSGLPLHSQDEDQSIGPRLRALPGLPASTHELLDSLEDEHDEIHAATRDVLGALERIAQGTITPLQPERLVRLLRTHLEREEALLFPLVPLLSAESQDRIVWEIRRRRAAA